MHFRHRQTDTDIIALKSTGGTNTGQVPIVEWFLSAVTWLESVKQLSKHCIPTVGVGRRVAAMFHRCSPVDVHLLCWSRHAAATNKRPALYQQLLHLITGQWVAIHRRCYSCDHLVSKFSLIFKILSRQTWQRICNNFLITIPSHLTGVATLSCEISYTFLILTGKLSSFLHCPLNSNH